MVVDVSAWHAISPEPGGRDQHKVWLAETAGAGREDWWLWKPLKPTDRDAWRINDAAEVVAYSLARAVGLPAARGPGCRSTPSWYSPVYRGVHGPEY